MKIFLTLLLSLSLYLVQGQTYYKTYNYFETSNGKVTTKAPTKAVVVFDLTNNTITFLEKDYSLKYKMEVIKEYTDYFMVSSGNTNIFFNKTFTLISIYEGIRSLSYYNL